MSSGPVWFGVGIAIYAFCIFILWRWAKSARHDFMFEYDQRTGADLPASDLEDRVYRGTRGIADPFGMSWRFLKLSMQPLSDRELDRLRRRWRRREVRFILAMYVLFAIPISFSCLGQW